MDNPFEHFASELRTIQNLLNEIKAALPENNPIKRYSVQELAGNTPLTAQTIRSKIKNGTIKADRFGNKYLITAEEFNRVCKEVKSIKFKREQKRTS